MRHLYTALWTLLMPLVWCRLYLKGKRLPAYRQRIKERFSVTVGPADVWVHAVSLGEVVAVTPLIEALLEKQYKVLVTTMTPTGSERVSKTFGERVQHQYIPYDYPWICRRFFKVVQPKVGIIMETELWPNLIVEAKRAGVALYLMNARISDAAYKQYLFFKRFFKPLLNSFDGILAQSQQDADRFIAVGAAERLVSTTGNMKFDYPIPKAFDAAFQALKNQWGFERPVCIIASTHEGEEVAWLSAFKRLQEQMTDVLMILVPRHPERFQAVYESSKRLGFKTGLRSQSASISEQTEVVVVDALGELLGFYSVSDYAFVGGSLVPIGGHNVLEPIALGVPVFCGPYMNNAKAICSLLEEAKALQQLETAELIVDSIIAMHQAPEAREQQVSRATDILESNRGSIDRYLKVVTNSLDSVVL